MIYFFLFNLCLNLFYQQEFRRHDEEAIQWLLMIDMPSGCIINQSIGHTLRLLGLRIKISAHSSIYILLCRSFVINKMYFVRDLVDERSISIIMEKQSEIIYPKLKQKPFHSYKGPEQRYSFSYLFYLEKNHEISQ